MEVWKDIIDYEGLYQISNKGNVRRIANNGYKLLKPYDGWLYQSVDLSKDGEHHRQNIHRLVALHFIPNPKMCPEVNHKDGNKHNNSVENLEWVTQKENQDHATNVLNRTPFGKKPRKVHMVDMGTNEIVQEFNSVSDAGRYIDKPYARVGITSCCQGSITSAYGFKWEYAD